MHSSHSKQDASSSKGSAPSWQKAIILRREFYAGSTRVSRPMSWSSMTRPSAHRDSRQSPASFTNRSHEHDDDLELRSLSLHAPRIGRSAASRVVNMD